MTAFFQQPGTDASKGDLRALSRDEQAAKRDLRESARAEAARRLRRAVGACFCAALLLMLAAGVSRATTLEAYRKQVGEAAEMLEALPQWRKVESEALHTRRVAATLQQVQETLLPVQTIELNGAAITVDNKWLAEAVWRYGQIPAGSARRDMELTQIAERLRALDERLAELVSQKQNSAGKDEEKKKLEGILQRPEYGEKSEGGSAFARLWQRLIQWWRSLFPKQNELTPERSKTVSSLAQILVIGLTLAVIVYLLWKFTPMFRRKGWAGKPEAREARIVLGERLAADQTSADLLAEAEALARAGDLRAAIRKGYIALLCELGDRKLIGLAQHKTNRDYLRAVRQIEPLHGQMQQLTRSFENHWYGYAPATESDWNAFRSGFQRAVTSSE
ncbi:MAG TPA: DUF4129 domain-containing protein [Pyrinomonadaceae bacterium]